MPRNLMLILVWGITRGFPDHFRRDCGYPTARTRDLRGRRERCPGVPAGRGGRVHRRLSYRHRMARLLPDDRGFVGCRDFPVVEEPALEVPRTPSWSRRKDTLDSEGFRKTRLPSSRDV